MDGEEHLAATGGEVLETPADIRGQPADVLPTADDGPVSPAVKAPPDAGVAPENDGAAAASAAAKVPDARAVFADYAVQFRALYFKSFLTIRNSPSVLCSIWLVPVLFLFLLEGVRQLQRQPLKVAVFEDTVVDKAAYPRCMYFDQYYAEFTRHNELYPCFNLLYGGAAGTGGDVRAAAVAERLKANIGEAAGADHGFRAKQASSEDELFAAVYREPGRYDMSVWFSTDTKYRLWVNDTAGELYERYGDYFHYVKAQAAIENALLEVQAASASSAPVTTSAAPSLDLLLRRLPNIDPGMPTKLELEYDFKARRTFSYFDDMGAVIILFALTLSGSSVMHMVVREKRAGTLKLMRVMGLREICYWLAWLTVFMLFFLFAAVIFSGCGKYLTKVKFFTHCDFGVLVFVSWCYLSCYGAVTLFFCSWIVNWYALLGTQIALIAFPVVFYVFMTDITWSQLTVPQDWWTRQYHPDNQPVWIVLLSFMPWWHLAKIVQNIYDVTGVREGRSARHAHERYHEQWNNKTQEFTADLLFQKVGYSQDFGFPRLGASSSVRPDAPMNWTLTTRNPLATRVTNGHWQAWNARDRLWIDKGESWYAPSVGENCLILLAWVPFWLLLTWYCAHVFSAGEGKSLPYFFPFYRSFWLRPASGAAIKRVDADDTVGQTLLESRKSRGIHCLKLSKAYDFQTALRELSMEMKRNEITCLLGHNGAGKSTLINLLTGLHPPTHGHAFFDGLSIADDIATIQRKMGICPQDHIFFSDLTGRQHLVFWTIFKNAEVRAAAAHERRAGGQENGGLLMASSALESSVDALLKAVNLDWAADKLVRNYSGGMQRRLCVAIASIGDPEMIFLDEPTTGLDPVSRRQIWDFIQELKTNRVVVLTTHSMEEADCLADQIGILSVGRLKCLGTSLALKNKYGSGFRLSFSLDLAKGSRHEIRKFVTERLPGAKVLVAAGTNLTMGVPRSLASIMPRFLKNLEDMETAAGDGEGEGERVIVEHGISNSTLEEVFMNITAAERPEMFQNLMGDGVDNFDANVKTCVLCCANEAVGVTAFTKKGVPFLVDGVICRACAEGLHDPEKVKNGLASAVPNNSSLRAAKEDRGSEGSGQQEGANGKNEESVAGSAFIPADGPEEVAELAAEGEHSAVPALPAGAGVGDGCIFRSDCDRVTHVVSPGTGRAVAVSDAVAALLTRHIFEQRFVDLHGDNSPCGDRNAVVGDDFSWLSPSSAASGGAKVSISTDTSREVHRLSASTRAKNANPELFFEGVHEMQNQVQPPGGAFLMSRPDGQPLLNTAGRQIVCDMYGRPIDPDGNVLGPSIVPGAPPPPTGPGSGSAPPAALPGGAAGFIPSGGSYNAGAAASSHYLGSGGNPAPAAAPAPPPPAEVAISPATLYLQQSVAILLKNAQIQMRQKWANCARLCCVCCCTCCGIVVGLLLAGAATAVASKNILLTEYAVENRSLPKSLAGYHGAVEHTLSLRTDYSKLSDVQLPGRYEQVYLANRTADIDAEPDAYMKARFKELKRDLLLKNTDLRFQANAAGDEGAPDFGNVGTFPWWLHWQLGEEHVSALADVPSDNTYPAFTAAGQRLNSADEWVAKIYQQKVPVAEKFGYKLNYCPRQNLRHMHVNPKTDLSEELMWKTVLVENYAVDESKWYYHGPLSTLTFAKATERNTWLGGLWDQGYEYHHACGLQTKSCQLANFSFFRNYSVEADGELYVDGGTGAAASAPSAATIDNSFFKHYTPLCSSSDGTSDVLQQGGTEAKTVPQLGNLRAWRKRWVGRDVRARSESRGSPGAARTQTLRAVQAFCGGETPTVAATSAVHAERCRALAKRYATVDVWWEKGTSSSVASASSTHQNFDLSWLGIADGAPYDGNATTYWSSQARYVTMALRLSEVGGFDAADPEQQNLGSRLTGLAGKFVHAQKRFRAAATPEADNKCLRTSDPAFPSYYGWSGGGEDDDDDDGEGRVRNMDARELEGFVAMGSPRWHRNSDKPRYVFRGNFSSLPAVGVELDAASQNETSASPQTQGPFYSAILAAPGQGQQQTSGVSPTDEEHDDAKPFPDVALTIRTADKNSGQLSAIVHVAARDSATDPALLKRTVSADDDDDGDKGIEDLDPLASKDSLFDYVYALFSWTSAASAANADDVAAGAAAAPTSGDCKLDFLAPTSVMQLHTLVAALSNGIRLHLNLPAVEGDVLSHLPYLFQPAYELLPPSAGLQTTALPILSLLWFPVVTTNFGYEKRFGLLEMMRIQSLSPVLYWATSYLWFFLLYFLIIGSYLALFYAVSSDEFDMGQLFLVHFLWGHSQIALSLLCAAAFWRSESLTAVTYFWMSVAYLTAGPLLEAATVDGGPMPWALVAWGPTNYGRSLVLCLKYYESGSGSSAAGGEGKEDDGIDLWERFSASEKDEYADLLLVQFLLGTLILVVAIAWLQNAHVVLLHTAQRMVAQLRGPPKAGSGAHTTNLEGAVRAPPSDRSADGDDTGVEDSDVRAEASRILNSSPQFATVGEADSDAIQLRKVFKQYPDGKKAVRGVSFGVKKGECFGLLGPNGAGKTSCINLVCGLQSLSGGSIWVGGHEIVVPGSVGSAPSGGGRGASQASQFLGVCPQFDCVWGDLTVEEHLKLYARIKGVSGYRQAVLVRKVAEAVALEGDAFKKLAAQLSGGMRRRLSLAIALVTDPAVLILDEPTTGLDPDTRAGLWRVIAAEAKKRAVVLTTHSMEEADALCERIGIMCSGRLKCLGTPLHLKNKFGAGYMLSVALSPEAISRRKHWEGEICAWLRADVVNVEGAQGRNASIGIRPVESRGLLLQYQILTQGGNGNGNKNASPGSPAVSPAAASAASPSRSSQHVPISVSRIFEQLEAQRLRQDLPVREWSLAKTTLDEVFLRIVTDDATENQLRIR
eukprot:g11387.t1